MNNAFAEFLSGVNSISSDVSSLSTADSDGKITKVMLLDTLVDGNVNHYMFAVGDKVCASAYKLQGFTAKKRKEMIAQISNRELVKMAKAIGLSETATILASAGKLGKQSVHMEILDNAKADNAFGFLSMESVFEQVTSLSSIGRCSLKELNQKALVAAEAAGDENAQLGLIIPVVMSSLSEAKVGNGIVKSFENKLLATAKRINRGIASSSVSDDTEVVSLDLSDI